jgi:hypothetical protein
MVRFHVSEFQHHQATRSNFTRYKSQTELIAVLRESMNQLHPSRITRIYSVKPPIQPRPVRCSRITSWIYIDPSARWWTAASLLTPSRLEKSECAFLPHVGSNVVIRLVTTNSVTICKTFPRHSLTLNARPRPRRFQGIHLHSTGQAAKGKSPAFNKDQPPTARPPIYTTVLTSTTYSNTLYGIRLSTGHKCVSADREPGHKCPVVPN